MSWGISTIECYECNAIYRLKGWLPTTLTIWKQNEGLECCGVQTKLVGWEATKDEN